MTPKVLQALEFRSNNEGHRPVILAIELLRRHADSKERPPGHVAARNSEGISP